MSDWKSRSIPVIDTPKNDWKSRSVPVASAPKETRESIFKKYGKVLPVAGSVVGGLAGTGAGTVFGMGVGAVPGSIGGSALGGAAGEAVRQTLGRILGEDVPMTAGGAAKEIGVEGAESALSEIAGMGIGKAAGAAYKAFPKFAHGISGTPAVNIARAQQRGFKVLAPGISREAAGKAQAAVEHPIIAKLFTPEEQVLLQAKDAGFADDLMKSVMLKQIKGEAITPKEAVGLRILAPVKRAADTLRGVSKNVELDKAVAGARGTIAKHFPELTKSLADTERAITASQLRMPVPVNKTNPNQANRLFTGLGGMATFIDPRLLAGLAASSPLSMGLMAATMGQFKRSVPAGVRRGIQRGTIQSLERALSE